MKKGKGSKTLNQKRKKIAEYIADRINFNYIPAVRTDNEVIRIVNEMMSSELVKLEAQKEYLGALDTIKELQMPVLKGLSNTIKKSLKEFIPNINDVSIEVQDSRRRSLLRQQFDIMIDDGTKTNLEFKGDGVKSLAALGLLKNKPNSEGTISLIAIEEPESHLHSGAIHTLRKTIYELSKSNQVIISSHNPLFVDRNELSSNIIIDFGKAKTAKSIKEIRDIMGIEPSDNLVNSAYVLLVEGDDDVISLKAILSHISEKVQNAIKSNLLTIIPLDGAGNLSYQFRIMKNQLYKIHIFLDNDKAGQEAIKKIQESEDIETRDYTLINCNGQSESEFEDCLNEKFVFKRIQRKIRSRS